MADRYGSVKSGFRLFCFLIDDSTEKDRRQQAITVREKLEASRRELDQAQSRGDFAKAGELKYSIIPKLESQVHRCIHRQR